MHRTKSSPRSAKPPPMAPAPPPMSSSAPQLRRTNPRLRHASEPDEPAGGHASSDRGPTSHAASPPLREGGESGQGEIGGEKLGEDASRAASGAPAALDASSAASDVGQDVDLKLLVSQAGAEEGHAATRLQAAQRGHAARSLTAHSKRDGTRREESTREDKRDGAREEAAAKAAGAGGAAETAAETAAPLPGDEAAAALSSEEADPWWKQATNAVTRPWLATSKPQPGAGQAIGQAAAERPPLSAWSAADAHRAGVARLDGESRLMHRELYRRRSMVDKWAEEEEGGVVMSRGCVACTRAARA